MINPSKNDMYDIVNMIENMSKKDKSVDLDAKRHARKGERWSLNENMLFESLVSKVQDYSSGKTLFEI